MLVEDKSLDCWKDVFFLKEEIWDTEKLWE